MISLVEVSKRYLLGDGSTVTAADQVTATFTSERTTALVGPSGSGKSTLLHLIGALDAPDSGRIEVAGEDLTKLSRRQLADYRSRVGFVFQQFHLLPALTVADNVAAGLVGRLSRTEQRERVAELLQAVGLADRAQSRPDQLSGGQQQRVAIARALAVHPTVLLADEPTGNLDSDIANEIVQLLKELQQRYQAILLIATHDQRVADSCDQVLALRDGRVVAEAAVA